MRQNLDRKLWSSSRFLCGVDEVGRGALAGPVVAVAVVLKPGTRITGADDSKQLSPVVRARLEPRIKAACLGWRVAAASPRYIDRYNIHQATFHAMRLAVSHLSCTPSLVIADGWPVPGIAAECRGIVGGDAKSLSIACASIIAKVFRDNLMTRLDARFPGYGLAGHKGYGTPEHLAALELLGPSPVHRRSFAPVAALIAS